MRVRVVNPNTSAAMTRAVGTTARAVASSGTTVEAVNPADGPAAVETPEDEALAVVGLLAEVRRGEAEGVDGWVVACFGDPGVEAARAVARGPVVGIAEAAMRAAADKGRFSVVTTLESTCPSTWELVRRHGLERSCLAVRATGIAVLELEDPAPAVVDRIVAECLSAVAEDGARAVVLGCAGMSRVRDEVAGRVPVPVVDGVAEAIRRVELLTSWPSSRTRPDPARSELSEGSPGPG